MSATPTTKTKNSQVETVEASKVRILSQHLTVETHERLELINLTDRIAELVSRSGIRDGIVTVSSLHTTLALFINEFQDALLHDVRTFLESLVRRENPWRHNDPAYSDCDRHNADSHLRALVLGHNLCLQIKQFKLLVGQFQAIILAELDGPRQRELEVQFFGMS